MQAVVLLLSLNERSHCLLDGADSGSLPDLVESILHGAHIPNILVHKSLLSFISRNDLSKTQPQHIDMIAKVADTLLLILLLLINRLIVLKRRHVIFLDQLLTHLLNLVLERLLIFLMLSPQSDALVSVLLC
jgi:hypothetical protein